MHLTPEQKLIGRRNFSRLVMRGINSDQFKLETCVPLKMPGGPVKGGIVGVGRQGSGALLDASLKEFIDIEAICDINPVHRTLASQQLVTAGFKKPREYEDWKEMAQKENLEAVMVATPLWTHSEIAIGFLQEGINVLCEKMMAYDVASGHRMLEAARTNHRLLEIGYPRFYEPLYRAVYDTIIRPKLLGDIHFVRLHTHRNQSWRSDEKPPSNSYNPSRWGYPDWESLANWRMYNRYSHGLVSELGSHQISLVEWFLGSTAQSVYGSGGINCYRDGREVDDHIYMTFDHPSECTVELSVILSNSYGGQYEEFLGTNGSLILSDLDGGMFFPAEAGCVIGAPINDRDETAPLKSNWDIAFRAEVWTFCSAIRQGTPLGCGPERALNSAIGALAGKKMVDTRSRIEILR